MKKLSRDKVIAAHLGVAIGDAMGAPVETMTSSRIKEVLGPDGVTGYLPAVLHKHEWARGLAPGATTDDWALTAAMSRAIIKEPNGVTLRTCVEAHLHAYHNSPFGFGKTTMESMARWESGATELAELYSHAEATVQKKSGNGTIMKLMPVVLLGIEKGDVLGVPLLHMSSRITHRDARSIVLAHAAYVYAVEDYRTGGEEAEDLSAYLLDMSIDYLDRTIELSMKDKELFASDIAQCLTTITTNIASLPSRFTAMETAPFVISVCQHVRSFKEGILLAVNAGGDTDTNASIVGGILGLRYGTSAIPQEWVSGCLSSHEAVLLANQLCDALDIA